MIDNQPKPSGGGCGKRPDLLPWTRFNWCAISNRGTEFPDNLMLYGTTQLPHRLSADGLRNRILSTAASMSQEIGAAWDPFNVEVIIKPATQQPSGGPQ